MTHIRRIISLTTASVLVAVLLAIPAQAQQAAAAEPGDFVELISQEGAWTEIMTGETVPSSLADINLDVLSDEEWKELCKDVTESVRTSDGKAWERAVQDVIYLSFFYPDEIRFKKANLPLFYDYVLGRDEQHRIMALAALHGIGDRNTMSQVAQRVRLERSPRVKHLAAAAVIDHFSETSIEVEEPRRVDR